MKLVKDGTEPKMPDDPDLPPPMVRKKGDGYRPPVVKPKAEPTTEEPADSRVMQLTGMEEFQDIVSRARVTLVEFYAPWSVLALGVCTFVSPPITGWLTNTPINMCIYKDRHTQTRARGIRCGHCKKLTPEYTKAAKTLASDRILLAKVDATDEKNDELKKRFDISSFPTLKIFVNGDYIKDYSGGRTEADIVRIMRDTLDAPAPAPRRGERRNAEPAPRERGPPSRENDKCVDDVDYTYEVSDSVFYMVGSLVDWLCPVRGHAVFVLNRDNKS